MASLPPKPQDASPRERFDSRDRRTSRERSYRGSYRSPSPYGRRRRPLIDSYVAHGPRRDEPRYREYDRERSYRDRSRDRDAQYHARYNRDRPSDRESRFEHERYNDRYRDSRSYTRRDPSPRPGRYYRSRSPSRRYSPGPRRSRSRSPKYVPRSRPRSRSPRTHSPSSREARRDYNKGGIRSNEGRNLEQPLQRSSPRAERQSTIFKNESADLEPTPDPTNPSLGTKLQSPRRHPSTPPVKQELSNADGILDNAPPLTGSAVDLQKESGTELRPDTQPFTVEQTKPLKSPSSPPRQPRHFVSQTSRHISRSPPRGPRNHPKTNVSLTGPNTHGPQGLRRPQPPSASLSPAPAPSNVASSALSGDQPSNTPVSDPHTVALSNIPVKPAPLSLAPDLDAEMTHLQNYRARLASEYVQLSKLTRRALHELETATMELLPAELRRKVAEVQHEKARNGMLGIDHVTNDMDELTATSPS